MQCKFYLLLITTLFLISFTSASITVTLNSPEDMNYSTYNVSFNASATVDSPNYLKNISLYTNSTGSWGLSNTTTIYGDEGVIIYDSTTYTKGGADAQSWSYKNYSIYDQILNNYSLQVNGELSSNEKMVDTWFVYTNGTSSSVSSGSYANLGGWVDINIVNPDNSSPVNKVVMMYKLEEPNAGQLNVFRNVLIYGTNTTNTETNLLSLLISSNTIWNVLACDNSSNCNFSASNHTVLLDFPNITINSPSSSISIPTININATYTANGTMDKCYYNITKGTNTEKPNTFINCSAFNDTYTLTLNTGDYVINFWGNTTQGIVNTKTQNFTYSVIIGSGGGGGGSVSTIGTNEEGEYVSVCSAFKDSFREKVQETKSVDSIGEKVKIIWVSFWDYVLCSASASIVPI